MYRPLTLALHPRTHEAAFIRSVIPHIANAHTPQTRAAQNRIGLLNETACAPHEQALARAHLVRERRHVWSLAMAACSCRWICSNSQSSFSKQSSCVKVLRLQKLRTKRASNQSRRVPDNAVGLTVVSSTTLPCKYAGSRPGETCGACELVPSAVSALPAATLVFKACGGGDELSARPVH